MKLAPLDSAYTELSIHAKTSSFYEKLYVVYFSIAGHYFSIFIICRVAVVPPTVAHGRPGLGVPVLPPIPSSTSPAAGPAPHPHPPTTSSSSSASAVPTRPPPPYKVRPSPPSQHRDAAAPPPYTPPTDGQRSGGQSSPRQPARPAAPPVTPRTYKLPDPSVSQLVLSRNTC